MSLTLSKFGHKFTRQSAINQLMEDLGAANASQQADLVMLGGGNPASIPEAQALFGREMESLIDNKLFQNMIGLYDGPQGASHFRHVLSEYLNEKYGWQTTPANISLTNGSQNSFFYLFNALAGEMPDGSQRKIMFPLAPEYVGYADAGLTDDMFRSTKPSIELIGEDRFKYHIDFEQLEINEDIGALCLSRPTNPTGNVVSDEELLKLDKVAKKHGIPLIIDNAYGDPFPSVIHTPSTLHWNDNVVLCMSLSKLGLPGARTGIVIANQAITDMISSLSGIITLAPNSVGAALLSRTIEDGEINYLTNEIIKPFYTQKLEFALEQVNSTLKGLPVRLHQPEGAFFLWMWFEGLPISSNELYQRLKKHNVFVIPGEDFFIGIDKQWQHTRECIRINYAVAEDQLTRGLAVLAQQLRSLYAE